MSDSTLAAADVLSGLIVLSLCIPLTGGEAESPTDPFLILTSEHCSLCWTLFLNPGISGSDSRLSRFFGLTGNDPITPQIF